MERATFSGTTGDLSSYSSFSVPSRWNRNSLSICAILFNSAGGWRLEFIPPFSMFPGKRCLRAVAVFLFISYRNVENGNCICRRKIVLDSFDFVKIRSQSNFHFWTKLIQFFVEIVAKYRQCYNIHFHWNFFSPEQ